VYFMLGCVYVGVCVWVCVRVFVHVWDYRVGFLGMSHHSSMFPFSSVGTLVFLLADLFASCEVPVMHALTKVTGLLAGDYSSVQNSLEK